MLVSPPPILTPLPGLKPSVLSIPVFTPLFHQPVAISPALVFIPFVPITAVTIVITVMFFRKTHYRRQERTAQQQDCYESFHRLRSSAVSLANEVAIDGKMLAVARFCR